MGFLISTVIFIGLTLIAMLLGGGFMMYVNLPALMVIFPPAIAFGIGATSVKAMKNSLKLAMTEQVGIDGQSIKQAIGFLRVTGNSAMWLGAFMTLLGFATMGYYFKPEIIATEFGPAFAIALLTLIYALAIKTLCYVAEQKIQLHYPAE